MVRRIEFAHAVLCNVFGCHGGSLMIWRLAFCLCARLRIAEATIKFWVVVTGRQTFLPSFSCLPHVSLTVNTSAPLYCIFDARSPISADVNTVFPGYYCTKPASACAWCIVHSTLTIPEIQ